MDTSALRRTPEGYFTTRWGLLLAVFVAIFGTLLVARLPGFVLRMRHDLRRRPSDV